MSEGNLSISREALRAELSQLELRIVDRLTQALEKKADHFAVEALELRVQGLELSRAERTHMSGDMSEIAIRLTRLERFRYAVPGVGVLSLIVTLGILLFKNLQ